VKVGKERRKKLKKGKGERKKNLKGGERSRKKKLREGGKKQEYGEERESKENSYFYSIKVSRHWSAENT
jgi:hypothetical protein